MEDSSNTGKEFFLGINLVDVVQGKHCAYVFVTYDFLGLVGSLSWRE